MDVPLIVRAAESDPHHAEGMSLPGAKRSLQTPKFEYAASSSTLVDAATVMTSATLPGLYKQLSALSLPAAATTVMPSVIIDCTALSNVAEAGPPRLMFTTAGVPKLWSATIQSIASTRMLVTVLPLHESAFTGTIEAPLATPYVVPAAMPATWVPCPLQSHSS